MYPSTRFRYFTSTARPAATNRSEIRRGSRTARTRHHQIRRRSPILGVGGFSGFQVSNRALPYRRTGNDQDLEGECLTLITNAVLCWNTMIDKAFDVASGDRLFVLTG